MYITLSHHINGIEIVNFKDKVQLTKVRSSSNGGKFLFLLAYFRGFRILLKLLPSNLIINA